MNDHKALWLALYGDDYETQDEREIAYQAHQEALEMMRRVFGEEVMER